MDWLTGLYSDLSNGFSMSDIPVILVQCFISLLFALILKKQAIKKFDLDAEAYFFLPASIIGVGAGIIAKTGIQGAVLALGIILFSIVYALSTSIISRFYLLAIISCSLLNGFSQVPLALILFFFLVLFLFVAKKK
jgi:hypothetical protein